MSCTINKYLVKTVKGNYRQLRFNTLSLVKERYFTCSTEHLRDVHVIVVSPYFQQLLLKTQTQ